MVLSIWTTTHWGWLGLVIGFRSLFRLHSPCQVSVGRLGEDLLNTCQCWLLCATPVQNTSRIIRISWTLMKLNIDELLINLAHCPTYAIIFHSMTNLWRIILDNIYIYILWYWMLLNHGYLSLDHPATELPWTITPRGSEVTHVRWSSKNQTIWFIQFYQLGGL